MNKNEVLFTRTPSAEFCKRCKNALDPVTVAGIRMERFDYAYCAKYSFKPHDVLWEGAECERFEGK